jgi:hypothetical protein
MYTFIAVDQMGLLGLLEFVIIMAGNRCRSSDRFYSIRIGAFFSLCNIWLGIKTYYVSL